MNAWFLDSELSTCFLTYFIIICTICISRLMIVSSETKKEVVSDTVTDSRLTHMRILQGQEY